MGNFFSGGQIATFSKAQLDQLVANNINTIFTQLAQARQLHTFFAGHTAAEFQAVSGAGPIGYPVTPDVVSQMVSSYNDLDSLAQVARGLAIQATPKDFGVFAANLVVGLPSP